MIYIADFSAVLRNYLWFTNYSLIVQVPVGIIFSLAMLLTAFFGNGVGLEGLRDTNSAIRFLILAVSLLIPICLAWLLACFLSWLWLKIFAFAVKKISNKAIMTCLVFIIGFVVLWDLTRAGAFPFLIKIEKQTIASIDSDKLFKGYQPIQKVLIKNNFVLPMHYRLPENTICFHSNQTGLVGEPRYLTSYSGINLKRQTDFETIVYLRPQEKNELYLKGITFSDRNTFFDELWLFSGLGNDNVKICEMEDSILPFERIKIEK